MPNPPVSVANSVHSFLISHLQITITVASDTCIQMCSKIATAASENLHSNGCSNAAITIATVDVAIAYAGYLEGSIDCLEHSFSCAKNNNQLFPLLARYCCFLIHYWCFEWANTSIYRLNYGTEHMSFLHLILLKLQLLLPSSQLPQAKRDSDWSTRSSWDSILPIHFFFPNKSKINNSFIKT